MGAQEGLRLLDGRAGLAGFLALAAAREQGDEDAVEGVGQAGLVQELVVAAGVDQLKDAVAELGGMGQIKDEAVLLGGDLLVEGRGVGAVEVEPDEFGVADRVVFVRAVASTPGPRTSGRRSRPCMTTTKSTSVDTLRFLFPEKPRRGNIVSTRLVFFHKIVIWLRSVNTPDQDE